MPRRETWAVRSFHGTRPRTSHRPLSGTRMPTSTFDGGGLSGAVRPDVTDQLPRLQADGEAVQRVNLPGPGVRQPPERTPQARPALRDAEGLAQVLDQDLGHGGGLVKRDS